MWVSWLLREVRSRTMNLSTRLEGFGDGVVLVILDHANLLTSSWEEGVVSPWANWPCPDLPHGSTDVPYCDSIMVVGHDALKLGQCGIESRVRFRTSGSSCMPYLKSVGLRMCFGRPKQRHTPVCT